MEANVLKALASAPELANQSITTKTVYGTVTLSGSVSDEAARTRAENLTANAIGVKKVVDELQLGSAVADNGQQMGNNPAAPLVLQSDGTYAPAPAATAPDQGTGQTPAPGSAPATTAQRNNPDADQALDQQMQQQTAQGQPGTAQPGATPQYPAQQYPAQQYPNAAQTGTTANGQPTYPQQQPYGRRPMYAPGYPSYPTSPYGYPQSGTGAYAQQSGQPGQQQFVGGQAAGQVVTIPAGALLRVRVDRTLSSKHTQPGTTFNGVVMNDVVANGFVAIPRGATVQGKVIDAKASGALSGRGEMSLQLTRVTLGGKTYPLNSDLWAHNGGDKTIETINKTAGFGALGAVVGALAGGGVGAAVGGGVGAAAGLGSSAASGNGQVIIPAEALINFTTAGENQVATVSEQEMQRLAYTAGPGGGQSVAARAYRVYPGYYPAPGYYPYPAYRYPNY